MLDISGRSRHKLAVQKLWNSGRSAGIAVIDISGLGRQNRRYSGRRKPIMTKKITDYQIIRESSRKMTSETVLNLIEDGWEPLGGPFVYQDVLNQAMIKYTINDPVVTAP